MIDPLASLPLQPRQGPKPAAAANAPSFLDCLARSFSDNNAGQSTVCPIPLTENVAPELVVDCLFEFHVQHSHGGMEVISSPWRLAANGSLAQTIAGRPPVVASAMLPALESGSLSAAHTGIRDAVVELLDTAGWRIVSADPGNVHVHVPLSVSNMGAGVAAPAAAASPALSQSVVVSWLTRMIRWIEQQGHDPVVWIRDYRLDDTAARQIVDALRALAHERGVSLQRIVVNARELWRAPPTAVTQENGTCP